MTETIRILIVDDHAVVREGLRTLITAKPGMKVVGEAVDGAEAVLKVISLKPDVILLDMVMPRKNGLETIKDIRQNDPDAQILVLTSFDDDERVFSAIKAGALGYLLKDSSPQQLLQAIHDVYQGQSSLHPTIALKVIRELNQSSNQPPTESPLTSREVEVLKLVAQGLINEEIAEELSISKWTVRTHVRNILGKLHLANRTQVALYALREGLADLDN
ncbi:response regulator transcription factor [Anaerolineales bacterium HSG6]|nr:response regulator transcription factor [Anaerolineales bacterium HSG6]MDM8530791.1 response regulator transcription factor [Anaerolineales bacterium HSG25]